MAKRSRGKFGIDEKEQKKAYSIRIALVPAIYTTTREDSFVISAIGLELLNIFL